MAVFPQASVLFNVDPNWTAAQARVEFERWLASTLQLPGAAEAEALTIATGQITPTRAAVIVDTEGGTSADDLTTIATANMHAGAVLMLCAANSGRTVTVRHGTGAGGIALLGGVDCVLSTTHWLMLRRVGDAWAEMPPLRAAQAQQADTASDMAAGHVLAGKTTAKAVRDAIGAPAPNVGKYSVYPIYRSTNQAIPANVEANVASDANISGTLSATKLDGSLGWTLPEDGAYNISVEFSALKEAAAPCVLYVYIKHAAGGTASYIAAARCQLADAFRWHNVYTSTPIQLLAGDAVFVTARAEGAEIKILFDSGRAILTRLR